MLKYFETLNIFVFLQAHQKILFKNLRKFIANIFQRLSLRINTGKVFNPSRPSINAFIVFVFGARKTCFYEILNS